MMVKSGPANSDGQVCAPPDGSFGTIHSFNTIPRQFHSIEHCHTYRVRCDCHNKKHIRSCAMRFVAIFAFLASPVASLGLDKFSFETELLGIQFDSWAETHGKVYTCMHSKAKKFEVWRKNHGESNVRVWPACL